MFGYFFSKTDLVSGTICPVISGFDTTATVTVPELLSLPPPLVPPPEQAATATRASTRPAARSLRSLTREDLTNYLRDGDVPGSCVCSYEQYHAQMVVINTVIGY